jgi:5,10-methylenetetrahydromethanopterin reductase
MTSGMEVAFAPAGTRHAATAVAMALQAEQLGLAEVWISEDYLERGAFALAGAIAAATERVGIGIGVINPWTRHVAVTAMECGTLDELSGGRLLIGLGASNARWMEEMLGIPFVRPIPVLLEYAAALRTLLAGEHLTREVQGAPLDAQLSFTPRAGIPVQLGVKGPVALRRAGEVADGLMLSVLSSAPYVAWVRAMRPTMRLTAYAFVSLDDADPAAARDRIRPRVARFLGLHGGTEITARAGVPSDLAEELRRRMLAGEPANDLIDDELLDTVAVAGTTADGVEALRRFADAGLDVLVAMDHGIDDPQTVVERTAALARAAGSA